MTQKIHASGAVRPSAWRSLAALTLAIFVSGCASTNRAPIEDRTGAPRVIGASSSTAEVSPAVKSLPGAENAGKPGYYSVKPGDTLIRVGLENGQNWKDLVRWNNLDNPNIIEVGQVLRVVPPGSDPAAVGTRPVTQAKVEVRPLDAKPPLALASAPASAAAVPAVAASPVAAVREGDDVVDWMWPATGPVAAPFVEGSSKGVSILGKAGDPVLAAADGRVIYAGSGMRAYGNLLILKHNNSYLTAYAHNQSLLVKEDQMVKRGQRIADMGSSDSDRVQLHFELRKMGKPVDPVKLLPAR
ncbi:MAG: peptidoglycan DD-metalloendopeptidase family protein [Pseudorhodobacter sp.]|nr:peptidoglycan DD-metalloendopeptidase family protein [Rhizobacter sp.]